MPKDEERCDTISEAVVTHVLLARFGCFGSRSFDLAVDVKTCFVERSSFHLVSHFVAFRSPDAIRGQMLSFCHRST